MIECGVFQLLLCRLLIQRDRLLEISFLKTGFSVWRPRKSLLFASQKMGFWTFLEGFLLFANALAILNEDRFLAPRGWTLAEMTGQRRNSLKGQKKQKPNKQKVLIFTNIHHFHSTGIITSLVLNAGIVQGGLYLPNKKSPSTLNPSFSKLALSLSTFSLTTSSDATPPNFTTPYFLSPSSLITTLSSVGLGASSAFPYTFGKTNCIVTILFFFPSSPPPPSFVITGAVIAIFSPPLSFVMTGAVMAIFSGLVFWGFPKAPI
ncbi:hypothetical protein CR513_16169, partial [Mucuna pruriens]